MAPNRQMKKAQELLGADSVLISVLRRFMRFEKEVVKYVHLDA